MGIFQMHKNEKEDAATIPTVSEWKKARKQEKKDRNKALASKQATRANKIQQLAQYRNANSPSPQKETKKGGVMGFFGL